MLPMQSQVVRHLAVTTRRALASYHPYPGAAHRNGPTDGRAVLRLRLRAGGQCGSHLLTRLEYSGGLGLHYTIRTHTPYACHTHVHVHVMCMWMWACGMCMCILLVHVHARACACARAHLRTCNAHTGGLACTHTHTCTSCTCTCNIST